MPHDQTPENRVIQPISADAIATTGWTPLAVWGIAVILIVLLLGTNFGIQYTLIEPIRKDLGLTDTQVGHLHGFGVAVFSALAAFPIGWLADRWDRRHVLALCVLVWSAAIYLGGLANGFNGLFWALIGLAMGEAALAPIVYALTKQIAPIDRLAQANAAVYATLALGGTFALAAGSAAYGWVDAHRDILPWRAAGESWRLMFFLVALPGALVAGLLLTVRLAPHGVPGPAAAQAGRGSLPATTNRLLAKLDMTTFLRRHGASVICVFFAMSLVSMGWITVGMWTPTVLARVFHSGVSQAGVNYGLASTVASAIGIAGSYFWLARRTRIDGQLASYRLARKGTALAVVPVVLAAWSPSADVLVVLMALAIALLVGAFGQAPQILQQMAPTHLLSRTIALMLVVALPVRGGMPVLVGVVSDRLSAASPNGLLYAVSLCSATSLALAVVLLKVFEPRYARLVIDVSGTLPSLGNRDLA